MVRVGPAVAAAAALERDAVVSTSARKRKDLEHSHVQAELERIQQKLTESQHKERQSRITASEAKKQQTAVTKELKEKAGKEKDDARKVAMSEIEDERIATAARSESARLTVASSADANLAAQLKMQQSQQEFQIEIATLKMQQS